MITIEKCIDTQSIELSAIQVINQITYNRAKGMSKSYDNETYWDFGNNINKTIKSLTKQISSRNFKYGPLLKTIRKINKRERIIYIPPWIDKMVDRWLYDTLNKLLHDWFMPGCYAYRIGGFGVDACQNEITNDIKSKKFFVKRDISSYFYSIDHKLLLDDLSKIIDPNDYLYQLLESRIVANWIDRSGNTGVCSAGVPFGASISCLLANIFLRPIDAAMMKFDVNYYRYADDFLMTSTNADELLLAASQLDQLVSNRKLKFKESHNHNYSFIEHDGFEPIKKFKYLGLEFCHDKKVRLSIEKQRKIIRFYRRILSANRNKLRKLSLPNRIEEAVRLANTIIHDRIRSVAIIDYYLKHINDEHQLKILDTLIIELVVSAITGKTFRKGHFKIVSPQKLRDAGLISLVHRHRQHKHGQLRVNFFDLRNTKIVDMFMDRMQQRKDTINYKRLYKLTKNASRPNS